MATVEQGVALGGETASTQIEVSITVAAGDDIVILCSGAYEGGGDPTLSGSWNNGASAATELAEQISSGEHAWMGRVASPTAATAEARIAGASSVAEFSGVVLRVSDIDTTTPERGTATTGTGTTTTVTYSPTTVSGDLVVLTVSNFGGTISTTDGTRVSDDPGGQEACHVIYKVATGTSTTVDIVFTANQTTQYIGQVFRGGGGGGAATTRKLVNGGLVNHGLINGGLVG